jgi:hypothetical protein
MRANPGGHELGKIFAARFPMELLTDQNVHGNSRYAECYARSFKVVCNRPQPALKTVLNERSNSG